MILKFFFILINNIIKIKKIFIAARKVLPTSPMKIFAGCQFNKIKANISLYKLATENILMRKKLDILESEINQLKEIINNFK